MWLGVTCYMGGLISHYDFCRVKVGASGSATVFLLMHGVAAVSAREAENDIIR